MKRFIALIFLILCVAACTHVTKFNSSPSGAKVYLDGKYIGSTPTEYQEKTGQKSYQLRIEREGYLPLEQTLTQKELNTEVLVAGTAAGGATFCGGCFMGTFVCCWPLWYPVAVLGPLTAGYFIHTNRQLEDVYYFSLEPVRQPQMVPGVENETH